ncbi:MAG: mechanosensitive ion channel family protein, partial [Actinomycetota bacterium]|nr:mechanosensitive ion channel family protein [Actinomycetota bacterium]
GQIYDVTERGRVTDEATPREILFALGGALLTLVAGIAAVRSTARALRLAMSDQVGDARGGPAALIVSIAGYVIVGLTVLSQLDVDMGGLLLGGALTGVIVGIAAQQTLGNFFAGLVLLLVRPFTVGEHVVLKSGPLGGEFEGRVLEMSLFYVHLMTDHGAVALPNAGVLASAVGPGARGRLQEEDEAPPDDHGPAHGGTA